MLVDIKIEFFCFVCVCFAVLIFHTFKLKSQSWKFVSNSKQRSIKPHNIKFQRKHIFLWLPKHIRLKRTQISSRHCDFELSYNISY